ncbi:uncharacterized protein LOC111370265 isoform X2 [Olea europaea var. sylvestris]|uniref:uncharacterized protein LOC111370265 isoform X2 n=1 Tax=Olea europaea var. sylvestris TaxID=158386 RepID=UPI000C1CFB8F|nr:uncharacterized protein LOC111370265 isoform X2 [Olea europaea var. sylvestris]
MKPAWLKGLMEEKFFEQCGIHQNRRKNEKNIFCLNCCRSFCPHCLPSHTTSHPLLQVRRYVYQDVIRLDDLEKLIDCCYIQVDHMTCQGEDLSSILYRFDESDFTISQFEGLCMDVSDEAQMTPNPFLEVDPILEEYRGASDSSYGIGNSAIFKEKETAKMKGKGGFLPGIMLSLSSRRKGAPHRSPLS